MAAAEWLAPAPHVGEHNASEQVAWQLPAPGAAHSGYSPISSGGPTLQALEPGSREAASARPAPALRPPQAPMPASHPRVPCPGGSWPCSGHTYRTTPPRSASQQHHVPVT